MFLKKILRNANENENNNATNTKNNAEKDISDTINEKDSNLNETECKENVENSHADNFNNQNNSNDNLQNGNNICSTNENIINNKPDNESNEINNINENININPDKSNGIEINNVANPAPKKRGRKKRGEVVPNTNDLNLQLTKRVSVKNSKYHSFIEQEVGKKRRGRKSNNYYENDIKTNESMFYNSSVNHYESMQNIDNGHSMLNLNTDDNNINNNDTNNINNYYMYDRPPYYYCDIMGKDGVIPPPESGLSDYQNVYANEFMNNNLYNGMQTDNINYNYYLMDNSKQENPMFFHENLIHNEVMNTSNPPNTNTVVEVKRRGRKKKIRNENIMNNNNFVNNTNLGVPIKLGDNLNNSNPLNGQVNPLPIVEKKKRGRKKKNINNTLNSVTGLNIKQNGMEYKNEGIIDTSTNPMHGLQINNMGIGDLKNENTEALPFSSNYNNNSSVLVDYNGQSNGLNFQRENNDHVYNQNDNNFLKKRKYTKRKHKDRRSIDGNKYPRNQMSKYVSIYNNSINDKNYTIHNASNISRTIEKNIFANNKIKEFKTNNNKPLANEPYQIKEEFMNNVNSINTVFNFNEEFIKFLKKVNNFDDIDYNSMLSFLGNVQIKLTKSLNEEYSTENFNIHNVDHTIYAMKKIVDILNNNNEILSKLNQLEYKIYCDYYITKKQNSMKELHNNTDNNANKLSETEHKDDNYKTVIKDENNSQDNSESIKNKMGNSKLNEDEENQTNGDLEHIKTNNNDLKVNDDSGKICENDKEGIYQETNNIKDDAHNNKKEEPSNEYNINKLCFNKNVDFICNELNEFIKNTLKNENIFYSLYSDGRYHNTSEKSLYKNYVSTKLYKHNNIIDRSKIGRREKIILNKLYKNGEICEDVINRASKYVDENEPMEEKDQLLLNRYTDLFRKMNNINKGHSNSYNQINKPYNNGLQIDQHTLINKDDNMNFHKNHECNSVCPNCVSDVSNDNLMMNKNEVMGKGDMFYMSPNNSTNINNSSHIDVNNYSTGNSIVEHNKDVESDEMGTYCNMHGNGVNNINEQYKKSNNDHNNDNKNNDNLCECFEGTINQESMDEMSKLNNAETTITYDDLEYKNNPLDKKINDKTNIFDNNTTKENNENQCLLNNGISNIMSVNDNDNNESCNLTHICNTNSENLCDSNSCCNNNMNMEQYDYKKNLQSLLTETLNFRDDKLLQMKKNKSQKEMLNCLKMVSKIKQKFFDECTQMINNQIFTLEKNFRIPDCSLSMPSNELCYNTNS